MNKTNIPNIEYKTVNDCKKADVSIQQNPKYANFKQFIFTCGDKDDLKKYLIKPRLESKDAKVNKVSYELNEKLIILHQELLNLFENDNLPHYKNINEESFRNSLKYLFFKTAFNFLCDRTGEVVTSLFACSGVSS